MTEEAPSWGALEGKTWGELGAEAIARVPVEEDIQKTLDDLRADVETLKARVGQLEAAAMADAAMGDQRMVDEIVRRVLERLG